MAVLAGALTLADFATRTDTSGKTNMIVEMLSMTNEVLEDMLFVEANDGTSHQTTVRTGLPSATWRLLNYGVVASKSTTAKVKDTMGNLEAESVIDRDLVALATDKDSFRLSEGMAYFESLTQTMATTVWYGNETINPERFTGLTPRYSTISGAEIGHNILSGGGVGSDNTSIWIVTWGQNTTHGIFPRGSSSGLTHEDKGEERVLDASGNAYYALVDRYKWQMGMSVRDWRYNVRIANIDVSDLATGSAANIINLLIRGLYLLPTTSGIPSPVTSSDAPSIRGSMGRTVIYCNRTIRAYLDLQAMNKTNVWLSLREIDGRTVTTFRGIPIRTNDAILNTEAVVS